MKVFAKNSNIFRLLSEAVSEGILVVNDEQLIVAANLSAHTMFGYVNEELIGQPLNKLIPSDYRKTHNNYVKGFIKKGDKRQMGQGRSIYGCKKNGDEFPVEAGLNPFKILGNTYTMALMTDISERKKAEEELSHWFQVFNESLNEIYVFDAETFRFINVNNMLSHVYMIKIVGIII